MTTHLALTDLIPNPDNPRDTLGDLDDLAASIAAVGLIQQLIVTRSGNHYIVVDGHRRYWAMRSINYDRPIPVEIRHLDRGQRIAAAVAAGTFVRPISPIDQAKAFRALEDLGYTRAQIEQATGCNQPMISTRLRLLELTPQQQLAVHEGRMTLHQAKLATYELGRRRPDSAPRPPRTKPTGDVCPNCGHQLTTPGPTTGTPGPTHDRRLAEPISRAETLKLLDQHG